MAGVSQRSAFSLALADALNRRDRSLTWLHRKLRDNGNEISMTTLSYWRSGARRPEGARSLSVVEDIERLLGVEHPGLVALIGPTHRTGYTGAPLSPLSDDVLREHVEQMQTLLGAPAIDTIRDLSSHITATIGANGSIVSCTTRCIVQVTKGPVSELSMVSIGPEPWPEAAEISDVHGARLAKRVLHPDLTVSGMLLEFDRPVPSGETVMFEYTETFTDSYPAQRTLWHAVSRASHEIVLWVRFDAQARPSWCEIYSEPVGADRRSQVVSPVPQSVHTAHHRFGPGTVGIDWGFDDGPVADLR